MRKLMIVAALLLCASAAPGALSPDRAGWSKGPEQFLMTAEEAKQWNALQTDAQADEFVALFWARRDPTPGTPRNEFREDFRARVDAADQNFSTKMVKGSVSDRGKALILFGAPTRAIRTGGSGASTTSPAGGFGSRRTDPEADDTSGLTKYLWTYEGEAARKAFGAPRVELRFIDRFNDRNARMETPTIDFAAAQRRAVAASVTQPGLTKAPAFQTVTVPIAEPVAAAPAAFKTPSLETALVDAKGGKVASKGAVIQSVQLLSPAGEAFVPVGLYVPSTAELTSDAVDTFFGVIEDVNGKRVDLFEEPAKGTLSRNNYLYDRTIALPPGTYTATFGLAKAGVPVLMASGPIHTADLAKDTVGTSPLILSDIIETIEAAPPKAPFAFGKLKIVPRPAFSNKDELGYFIELHNPGIDPATNLPKMQAKLDLIQPSGPAISAPLTDAQALPLSGNVGPGEYAVISGIPLGQLKTPLKPGDYTLRVKLVDTVSKKSYTVEQKFKIVG